ncbi:MAG: hypothetical protein VX278_02425 [Myxococcota bacterium]|nr:hypothetical protein [Myxococcota bacterium]
MLSLWGMLAFAEAEFDEQKLFQVLEETAPYRNMRLGEGIPQIPEEAYQRAAQGEIITGIQEVSGHSASIGWGVAVLKAPIDDFWAGINDGEAHVGKTPIQFAKVISGEPCMDQREMLMILPIPIVSDRWWIIRSSTNPSLKLESKGRMREMSWSNVSNAEKRPLPEDLKERVEDKTVVDFTKGAWLVLQLDEEYILGEYHTWAIESNQLPFSVSKSIVRSSITKTIRAMESHTRTQPLRCLNKMP